MNNSTKSTDFLTKFHAERNAIQAEIDRLQNATTISALDLQPLSAKITDLGSSFTLERATEFLPKYDQMLSNKQMSILEAGLEALRPRAITRGRFTFKKKAANPRPAPTPPWSTPPASGPESPPTSTSSTPAPPSSSEAETEAAVHPLLVPRPLDTSPWSNATPHGRQFGNIRDGIISASSFFRPEESKLKFIEAEVTLVSLRNCIINLLPSSDPQGREIQVTALYARDLQMCIIMAGEITGSVRLEKVTVGTLIVGCHQLRMENCQSVSVYSAVKTAPAIENSKLIGFGPYPPLLPYPLDCESRAEQVQDFSSVGSGPSDNWKIIEDGSRLANHFIQLYKVKPTDWPNGGELLPLPDEHLQDGALSPGSEDPLNLLDK